METIQKTTDAEKRKASISMLARCLRDCLIIVRCAERDNDPGVSIGVELMEKEYSLHRGINFTRAYGSLSKNDEIRALNIFDKISSKLHYLRYLRGPNRPRRIA